MFMYKLTGVRTITPSDIHPRTGTPRTITRPDNPPLSTPLLLSVDGHFGQLKAWVSRFFYISCNGTGTAVITVCTVVQHCCNGRSKKYRKWHFCGCSLSETLQLIDITFGRDDYVGEGSQYAKWHINRFRGVISAKGWNVNGLCFLFIFLFLFYFLFVL